MAECAIFSRLIILKDSVPMPVGPAIQMILILNTVLGVLLASLLGIIH